VKEQFTGSEVFMSVGAVQASSFHPEASAITRQPDPKVVQQAVAAVNNAGVLGDGTEITYSVDPGSNKLLVRLVDSNTHEVLRQVPTEYVLRLARQLQTK
jgi:flagellar protein FlaG